MLEAELIWDVENTVPAQTIALMLNFIKTGNIQ